MYSVSNTIDGFLSIEKSYDKTDQDYKKSIMQSLITFMGSCINDDILLDETKLQIRKDALKVISAQKRKEGAVDIFNEYFEFLADKTKHQEYMIEIPSLNKPVTELERKLLLAKNMHKSFDIEQIAEEFYVSTRTIENDLKDLSEGNLRVMGQVLKAEYRRKRRKVYMPSTIHPLFLAQNLTQIVTLLNGLECSAKDPSYQGYAEKTAVGIWLQLSEYAKDRILNVLIEKMNLNGSWYHKINELASKSSSLFSNEAECSGDSIKESIWKLLKNSELFYIRYIGDNGEICEIEEAHIKHYSFEEELLVLRNGKIILIDNIIEIRSNPEISFR